MKSTGLVLKERAYVGGASPPDSFEDTSRHGNDGVHTDITWIQLPSGLWVRRFNGSTSQIAIAHSDSLNLGIGDFAIRAWMKNVGSTDVEALFQKRTAANNNCQISKLGTTNILQIYVVGDVGAESYVRTAGALDGDVWHFIVATVVNSTQTLKLYFDGVDDTNIVGDSWDGTTLSNVGTAYIGMDVLGARYKYKGDIVFFEYYKYAPSAEQIAANFQNERHWFGV